MVPRMNCFFARINRHLCGPSCRLYLTIKRTPQGKICYDMLLWSYQVLPTESSPFTDLFSCQKDKNQLLRWSVKMMAVSPRFSFFSFYAPGLLPSRGNSVDVVSFPNGLCGVTDREPTIYAQPSAGSRGPPANLL